MFSLEARTRSKRRVYTKSMLYSTVVSSLTMCGTIAAPAAARAEQAPAQSTAQVSELDKGAYYLRDHGVTFNINWWEQYASVMSGGERTGSLGNAYLLAWTYLDMDKLVGIPDANVRMAFTERSGGSLGAKRVDTDELISQFWGSGQTYQLSALSWKQGLFDKKAAIEIGRMDLSNNFDRSDLYCRFMNNATCGNPVALAKIINKGAFPGAVWGGTLEVDPTPNVYLKGGSFAVEPQQVFATTHGFDWSTAGSTGFTVPLEAGYKWKTPGAIDDNRYDFGAVIDKGAYKTSTFSKTFYTPSPTYSRLALFAQGQQFLWQAEPNSKRGVFGGVNLQYGASGSKQTINYSPNAVMVWQGPFESRPDDYFGVQYGAVHFNHAFLGALYKARTAIKGASTEHQQDWQHTVEADYSVAINSWMDVMPNVQWIIHPDGLGFTTYTKTNVPSAFIVGVQLRIGISDLLGLPKAGGGAVSP